VPESSNDAASGKPLTRTALIAQADAICASIDRRASTSAITKPSDYITVLLPLISFEQEEVVSMETLRPPKSLEREWRVIVAARRGTVDAFKRLAAANHTNKLREPLGALTAAEQREHNAKNVARRAGFTGCAREQA
jgi:hypothetical protein